MPIFRITARVDLEAMVYAETYAEAEAAANEAMQDHISDDGVDVRGAVYCHRKPVTQARELGDWRDSLPYNSDDERTCLQVLESEYENAQRTPPTAAELEAAGQQRLTP
jgi:hypothetical protein